MAPGTIDSEDGLRGHVGQPSPLVSLKCIDWLDDGAAGWIAAASLMIATFGDASGVSVTLGGGAPGWASGAGTEVRLPAAMMDDPALARTGVSFGSSFLIAGVNEILRINGTVAAATATEVVVTVEECYLHCGKALLRSEFWSAHPTCGFPIEVPRFSASSRFLGLATVDAGGNADLSPKGDAAGSMMQFDGRTIRFAERPGNKRIDSLRNIVTQPSVAAAVLIPGCTGVLRLSGKAAITDDPDLRAAFAMGDKVPALVTSVGDLTLHAYDSAALRRARPWPAPPAPPHINPARISVEHVRLNKNPDGKAAAEALSKPGLIEAARQKDYRENLY